MITVEEIMKNSKNKHTGKEGRDHKHKLDDKEFNIEGHTVRGKVCSVCGERFFLADDLLPVEELVYAKHSDAVPISIEDGVLLLAGTYPEFEIPGRLVMQKEMFLFEKSFAPEHGLYLEPMRFEPYHMGPFSKKLKGVLKDLRRKGLVEFRSLRGRDGTAYKLTPKGEELAENRKKLVSKDTWNQLRRRRRAWDELGSHGLLRLVYRDFSAYASKSEIKDRVERGPGYEDRTNQDS